MLLSGSTRIPFDTALSTVLEAPFQPNPIGAAASRSFRFCVPDEWYRRSKSRSVSSTSSDVSQDTIRRLADLEESEEEDDEGEPKVKMYAREDGTFSGEALVVYFKEDSVMLAENMLDDAEFRLGEASSRIGVKKADFSHKHETGSVEGSSEAKPRKTADKKKATRRIGKMVKCVGCYAVML